MLAQRPSETFLELAVMKRLDLTVEAIMAGRPSLQKAAYWTPAASGGPQAPGPPTDCGLGASGCTR